MELATHGAILKSLDMAAKTARRFAQEGPWTIAKPRAAPAARCASMRVEATIGAHDARRMPEVLFFLDDDGWGRGRVALLHWAQPRA
jgi:hypothetical protein